jgi:hypothetical protein
MRASCQREPRRGHGSELNCFSSRSSFLDTSFSNASVAFTPASSAGSFRPVFAFATALCHNAKLTPDTNTYHGLCNVKKPQRQPNGHVKNAKNSAIPGKLVLPNDARGLAVISILERISNLVATAKPSGKRRS